MLRMRTSTPADLPRQRELWALAFGDSGDYVDNFYNNYYRPERVLVLEEDGQVMSMTAWFDTALVSPEGEGQPVAYLYAVATHPDARGKGYAGALLAWADTYLKEEQGFAGVTTVPAQPSLHHFFRANGFEECFTHNQLVLGKMDEEGGQKWPVSPINAREYGKMREKLLENTLHISYSPAALTYQEGCCKLSGGGFYCLEGPNGPALVCAEGMEDGTLLVKELLCGQNVENITINALAGALPAFGGVLRVPGAGTEFGMLKWLDEGMKEKWDWSKRAYMGLAFD